MCLRVVKFERLIIIYAVNRAVEPAEEDGRVFHFCTHRFPLNSEGFEGDVQSGNATAEIEWAVNAFWGAFHIDVRELFKLAVVKKAVFVAVSVVADTAGKAEGKAFTVNQAVGTETLIAVGAGFGKSRLVVVGARSIVL